MERYIPESLGEDDQRSKEIDRRDGEATVGKREAESLARQTSFLRDLLTADRQHCAFGNGDD